jgi:hypothetical protein
MDAQKPKRILVVANRTAATPRLLDEIDRRAADGPCEFVLLIPDASDRKAADWTMETALRLMRKSARGKVDGISSVAEDPFAAVRAAVAADSFDEIIVSTLPRKISKWLRRDLIRRVEGLGLPVTAIVPGDGKLTREEELLLAGAGGAIGGFG